MNKENVNYTITWTQPLANWDPLNLGAPTQAELDWTKVECRLEIMEAMDLGFTEANEVLAKFMKKG